MNEEIIEDLFDHQDLIPTEVRNVLAMFDDVYPFTYEDCNRLIEELNKVGYTCQYGLDGEPYNLSKL
jgi:hypothetical protein